MPEPNKKTEKPTKKRDGLKGLVEGRDDRVMLIKETESNNGSLIKTSLQPSITHSPGCTCSFWSGTFFLTALFVLLSRQGGEWPMLKCLCVCVYVCISRPTPHTFTPSPGRQSDGELV